MYILISGSRKEKRHRKRKSGVTRAKRKIMRSQQFVH